MNAANPKSAPVIAARLTSARNSLLARSISYRMSCETSLAAVATRSPSDCWPSGEDAAALPACAGLGDDAPDCARTPEMRTMEPSSLVRSPGGPRLSAVIDETEEI